MDDVAIYDRALSVEEIETLMVDSVSPLYDNFETCDSADNDCKGDIDEDYPIGDTCGVGQCAGGGLECTPNGHSTRCDSMPGGSNDQSTVEICDYADNDCDNSTDEGFNVSSTCDTGMFGECSGGIIQCGAPKPPIRSASHPSWTTGSNPEI